MTRVFRIGALLAAAVLPSSFAAADSYPDRPIRAIASQGPGGLSDVFMRALADELGPEIGGTVVVEPGRCGRFDRCARLRRRAARRLYDLHPQQ